MGGGAKELKGEVLEQLLMHEYPIIRSIQDFWQRLYILSRGDP